MRPEITTSVAALGLSLALCLPLTAAAADYPIGEPIVKRTGIAWDVLIDHEGLTLSVRGRDCVLDASFRPGEVPRLDPADFAGTRLEDGRYAWELRAVPVVDSETRQLLAAARSVDDPAVEKRLAMQLRREGRIPWQSITQSGGFTLDRGAIILDEPEPESRGTTGTATATAAKSLGPLPTPKDFVINDDLIVDGSACIGFDCVNGESFGFDTIRLKENNLRIKFDDTSTAAGFPSRDWQLTANDSASGGSSKFSIEDITGARVPFTLEAGSPSNSLFVDDGGRVGLGTSAPSLELHVVNGDTPSIRLAQDGSSGFTPQTWDVAGNEANFFVRDVTGGSRLPFRIRPGAPSNSINIAADGKVGLGTTAPAQQLEVVGGAKFARATDNFTDVIIENTTIPATASSWILRANSTNGALTFTTSGITPLKTTSTGVEVTGTLKVNGVTMTVPDYVFEPTYELLPIERQGEYMLTHKHLPAVGGAEYDTEGRATLDLGAHQMGMLEELEKAHLYIQQLNGEIKSKSEQIAELAQKNAELETRLARLEAAIE